MSKPEKCTVIKAEGNRKNHNNCNDMTNLVAKTQYQLSDQFQPTVIVSM